jgi:hypothetical protein
LFLASIAMRALARWQTFSESVVSALTALTITRHTARAERDQNECGDCGGNAR